MTPKGFLLHRGRERHGRVGRETLCGRLENGRTNPPTDCCAAASGTRPGEAPQALTVLLPRLRVHGICLWAGMKTL